MIHNQMIREQKTMNDDQLTINLSPKQYGVAGNRPLENPSEHALRLHFRVLDTARLDTVDIHLSVGYLQINYRLTSNFSDLSNFADEISRFRAGETQFAAFFDERPYEHTGSIMLKLFYLDKGSGILGASFEWLQETEPNVEEEICLTIRSLDQSYLPELEKKIRAFLATWVE